MPRPIPMSLRQLIIERYKSGEKVSAISRKYKVGRRTVYNFIKKERLGGLSGLLPNYGNCGKPRPNADQFIYRAVRCMRTWHKDWGAEKIHAELLLIRPDLSLPHYRTFTRWFHWNNQLEPKLSSILPQPKVRQACSLHEGWQVDAKEEMLLVDGNKSCWLNITDEYSGTVIDPIVFPLKEN